MIVYYGAMKYILIQRELWSKTKFQKYEKQINKTIWMTKSHQS